MGLGRARRYSVPDAEDVLPGDRSDDELVGPQELELLLEVSR
jgi:hypothetical protein